MKKALDAAIGLRIARSSTGETRFGGHPNLSPDIRWPNDGAGQPMHHLLQLDCAALPVVDQDMPTTGTLSIFVSAAHEKRNAPSVMNNDNAAFHVLYQEASPADLPERPHPQTCPALGEGSLACEDVRYEVKTKKMGFFRRLVNTQPKAYSKSGGMGFFSAVPLEATAFDSFPTSDGDVALEALGAGDNPDVAEDGLRALQILGYAPRHSDLKAAHIAGYRACSDEKACAAYDIRDPNDVLLAQFTHDPALNLDLLGTKYALQFRISRADLRARSFDRAYVVFDGFGLDGLWWSTQDLPEIDYGNSKDFAPEIALKPLTPFEKPISASNYFCGNPQLPPDIAWPCRNDGYPLAFLMQIDCATLPRTTAASGTSYELPNFPQKGTIFLFADDFMEELGKDSIRLVYAPDGTHDTPERTPPEALQKQPDYADYNIRIRAIEGQVSYPDPKLPFEPVAFVSIAPPSGVEPDYKALDQARQRYGDALPHEDNALPGAKMLLEWLPNYKSVTYGQHWSPSHEDARTPVRGIPPSFPWRWADIRDATDTFPQDKYSRIPEDVRDAVFGSDLIAKGNDWKQIARSYGALERIPENDRVAYREWLLSMDACARNIPVETPKESAAERRNRLDLEDAFERVMKLLARPYPFVGYQCLPDTLYYLAYDKTADDLPDQMREVVAETVKFHRSNTLLRGNSQVHRANPDLMFSSDPSRQTSDTEILLFSLASGSGLPVSWGGDYYVLQIWIEAADLAVGRFDRIRTTMRG